MTDSGESEKEREATESGDVENEERKLKLEGGNASNEPPRPRDAGQRGTRCEHCPGMRLDVKVGSCVNPFSQEIAAATGGRAIRLL